MQKNVYPSRKAHRRESYARHWWRFVEPRPGLREALAPFDRCTVLAGVTRDVLPVAAPATTCFDHQLYVFAFSDWYQLGLLQSRAHRVWAEHRCSTLKDWLRYTATTVFETFPFPASSDGASDQRIVPTRPEAGAVSKAARAFYERRAVICRDRQLGVAKVHRRIAGGDEPVLARLYAGLNDAVDAAYGWPVGTWKDDDSVLRRLLDLNHALSAPRLAGAR